MDENQVGGTVMVLVVEGIERVDKKEETGKEGKRWWPGVWGGGKKARSEFQSNGSNLHSNLAIG